MSENTIDAISHARNEKMASETDREDLAGMVARYSMPRLLHMLADIAAEKAEQHRGKRLTASKWMGRAQRLRWAANEIDGA